MSLYEASLRKDIEEAKTLIPLGVKPRNVFERVIFEEARHEMREQERAKW